MFANRMGKIKMVVIAKNVSRLKGIFSTVFYQFNMSSNQENTKWVKYLVKTTDSLADKLHSTAVDTCFTQFCQNLNWLPFEVFIRLDNYSSTFDSLIEHEKSSSCHRGTNKLPCLVEIVCLGVPQSLQSFVNLRTSNNAKKEACSENPALYLSCCGCCLLRSSIRLKEITQFLRIHLR